MSADGALDSVGWGNKMMVNLATNNTSKQRLAGAHITRVAVAPFVKSKRMFHFAQLGQSIKHPLRKQRIRLLQESFL